MSYSKEVRQMALEDCAKGRHSISRGGRISAGGQLIFLCPDCSADLCIICQLATPGQAPEKGPSCGCAVPNGRP